MNLAAFMINSVFFAFNVYTLYFDYELTLKYKFLPVPGVYASKLVWLTMVNFVILTVYHGIGTILAVFQPRRESKIRQAFDFLATSIAFPLSATVTFLFWTLFLLDPNFLADKHAQTILSIAWYNHSLHTWPIVSMLFDFIAWRHSQPSKSNALKAISVFVILYTINIHVIHSISGFWAYPILGQFSLLGRSAFIGACMFIVYIAFIISNKFNSLL